MCGVSLGTRKGFALFQHVFNPGHSSMLCPHHIRVQCTERRRKGGDDQQVLK
jgi:hypothetical protein